MIAPIVSLPFVAKQLGYLYRKTVSAPVDTFAPDRRTTAIGV
jgi:hypothetical protein